MRISHAEKTDVGMKRDNNEDNYLVLPEQNLFAVFDGMGGHAAGEVASAIAVNEVKDFFRLTAADEEATWPFKDERDRSYDENRLLTGVKLANARILEASEEEGGEAVHPRTPPVWDGAEKKAGRRPTRRGGREQGRGGAPPRGAGLSLPELKRARAPATQGPWGSLGTPAAAEALPGRAEPMRV